MNRKSTKRCMLAKVYSEYIWKTLLLLSNKPGALNSVLEKIVAGAKSEDHKNTFLKDV